MAENPTRTYVENPGAYLDIYSVEDARRDTEYNVSKIKRLMETIYDGYPGFISPLEVVRNSEDPGKLDIRPFAAIDGNRNPMWFEGAIGVQPAEFVVGQELFMLLRVTLETTGDKRPNRNRSNRRYEYIVEEQNGMIFVPDPPLQDLCLGSITITIDEQSGQLRATWNRLKASPAILIRKHDIGGSVQIRPGFSYTVYVRDTDRSLRIWNNSEYVLGEFRFDSEGNPYEVIASTNVYTSENPEFETTLGLLYVSGDLNDEGKVAVTVRNNFQRTMTVFFAETTG